MSFLTTRRQDGLAVGAEGHRLDRSLVPQRNVARLLRGHVPESGRAVGAPREEESTVPAIAVSRREPVVPRSWSGIDFFSQPYLNGGRSALPRSAVREALTIAECVSVSCIVVSRLAAAPLYENPPGETAASPEESP